MDQIYEQLSFDTVIPSAILINENIELSAVKLYAFIKGLSKLHGYCFATNEYLANLMKSTPRAIQKWIIMLKAEGYLEIETKKNGIHWQRLIYISDKFKKSLRKELQFTPPRTVVHPPTNCGSPITKDYSNEDNLKREEAPPPPPPIFSYKRVRMDQDRYQSLIQEFGQSKISEMMERLDEYADINPKRFKQYACHAAVIKKWIRDDKEKAPKNKTVSQAVGEKSRGEIEADNRMWSTEMEKILRHYIKEGRVYCGANYWTFSFVDRLGTTELRIEKSDINFIKQCKDALKRMDIMV